MLSVGLTGSVASGKSTVARIWAREGVPVVSADELARRVVEPGTDGLAEVVEAFGEGIRASDGTLDREALRERIFRDPEERRRLEEILHPRIAELRHRWMEARRAEEAKLVVAEIPLLYETGLAEDFDVVVVVHASEGERLRRLVEERGLEVGEARRIMESQGEVEEKRARADRVLGNEGGVDALEEAALELLDDLRARVGDREGGGR